MRNSGSPSFLYVILTGFNESCCFYFSVIVSARLQLFNITVDRVFRAAPWTSAGPARPEQKSHFPLQSGNYLVSSCFLRPETAEDKGRAQPPGVTAGGGHLHHKASNRLRTFDPETGRDPDPVGTLRPARPEAHLAGLKPAPRTEPVRLSSEERSSRPGRGPKPASLKRVQTAGFILTN